MNCAGAAPKQPAGPGPMTGADSWRARLASLEASILGCRSMMVKTRCVADLPLATSAVGSQGEAGHSSLSWQLSTTLGASADGWAKHGRARQRACSMQRLAERARILGSQQGPGAAHAGHAQHAPGKNICACAAPMAARKMEKKTCRGRSRGEVFADHGRGQPASCTHMVSINNHAVRPHGQCWSNPPPPTPRLLGLPVS